MVAPVPTKRLTAEEFFEWMSQAENWDRNCELERGRIVERPLSGQRHGFVCANVNGVLGNYCIKRRKGYVCINSTGVIVERAPDTVRRPDLLLFDDVKRFDQIEDKFAERPAVLAVEVLSPDESHQMVMRRVQQFLHFGMRSVWVVDPEARNVVVYRAGQEARVIEPPQELADKEVLPDFSCRVREFFALPGKS